MNVSSVSLTSIQAMFYQTQYTAKANPAEHPEPKGKDQVNFSAQAQFLGGQVQQGPSPFKDLADALQAGDLAGAREAFAAIEQRIQDRRSDHHVNQGKPQQRFSRDFEALGAALQSGDLEAAKQAFETLLKNLPSARPHHRHPHGEPPPSTPQESNPTISSASASLLAMTYTSLTISSSETDSNPSSTSMTA